MICQLAAVASWRAGSSLCQPSPTLVQSIHAFNHVSCTSTRHHALLRSGELIRS
jgi:hypothetical protein